MLDPDTNPVADKKSRHTFFVTGVHFCQHVLSAAYTFTNHMTDLMREIDKKIAQHFVSKIDACSYFSSKYWKTLGKPWENPGKP